MQTEHCLICGSLNRLLLLPTTEAWECWNCSIKYWLDDQARLEYMVVNNLSFREANLDLEHGIPTFAAIV